MSRKKFRTDFLSPRSHFWMGAGTVFNLPGNYFQFNKSSSEEEADFRAIESDWGVAGQDIEEAMNAIENTIKKRDKNQLELAFTR